MESPEVWKIDPFTSVGPISAGMTESETLDMFGPPDSPTRTWERSATRGTQRDSTPVSWPKTGSCSKWAVRNSRPFGFKLAGVDLAGSAKRAVEKLVAIGLEPVFDGYDTWSCEGVRFGPDGTRLKSVSSTYLRLTQNTYPDDIWEYHWMRDL